MKAKVWLLVLLALPLAPALGGLSGSDTRQSAGIFVTVDGRVHTIYLDFDAAEFRPESRTPIPVTLTTDLDVWVEGHAVPARRYEWTFAPESPEKWTLGEAATPAAKDRGPGRRFLFSLRPAGREAHWLTASFSPEPATESVLLHLRYGVLEGTLRLSLREGRGDEDAAAVPVDLVELRALRDRLLKVVGVLSATADHRYAWSGFLGELGEEMISNGGRVTQMALDRTDDRVALTVRGEVPGERSRIDDLGDRLARGDLGRLFGRVAAPVARLKPKKDGWSFEITAESPRAEFERTTPATPLSEGNEAKALAEEILLLEERLGRLTASAVGDLSGAQTLLLSAKRDAGAMLSGIDPSEAQAGEEGLSSFTVRLVASGTGPSLIRFLRALEESPAPLRIRPVSFRQGQFAPELALDLTFLDYRPLSERNAGLLASIREKGLTERFDRNRELYLQGVAAAPAVPFRAPDWSRDPFSPPAEER